MAKLTKRSSGITDGFVSRYQRDDLIQKLGHIEHKSDQLAEQFCDNYCKYREDANELGMDYVCENCPLAALMEMIE